MSNTNSLLMITVSLIACCESVTAVAQSPYTLTAEPDSVFTGTRGLPIAKLIRVRVDSTGGRFTPDDKCQVFELNFITYMEGSVGPSPHKAQWDKEREGCFVEVVWKLGDYLGTQFLEGRMINPDSSTAPIRLQAYSHEPARLVVAVTLLTAHQNLTRAGRRRKRQAEEKNKTSLRRFVPMFGAEFSLRQRKNNIRMLVAGSIFNPGEEFFGGILVQPLISDPSFEGAPIQISLGVLVGDLRVPQLAFSLSLNGSGLLSQVFGTLTGGL